MFTSGTFDQMIDATMTQERLIAMMSGFFGALALLLAGLGLYGIVAQSVNARRTEIVADNIIYLSPKEQAEETQPAAEAPADRVPGESF